MLNKHTDTLDVRLLRGRRYFGTELLITAVLLTKVMLQEFATMGFDEWTACQTCIHCWAWASIPRYKRQLASALWRA